MKTKKTELDIYYLEPPNPKGNCWAMGEVLGYRFAAKVYPLHALDPSFELGRSRISKLEIRRFENDRLMVNFQRGWDLRPDSEILERAVQILCERLAKEVFPRWSFRVINRTVIRIGWFFKRRRLGLGRGEISDFQKDLAVLGNHHT
jgi:hypothetical protein